MTTTLSADEIARALIRQLGGTRSLSSAGSTRGTPSERAAAAKDDKILKDNTSAIRYLRDTLSKNNSLIGEMNHITKASNKVFNQAVDSVSSLKDLEKLPTNFKNVMMRSNSSLVKMMSQKMDTLESMFAAQEKIENLPQVKNLMDQFARGDIAIQRLESEIEGLGYTTEETQAIVSRFGDHIRDADGFVRKQTGAIASANFTVRQFDKEIKAANAGVAKFAEVVEKQAEGPGVSRLMKGMIGTLLLALGKDLLAAAQASMKFGTELNAVRSHLAGMKPEEYSRMQAENRQAINALTGGFEEFDGLISKSNKELTLLTGSLSDSTKLVADMITTSRLMGTSAVNTEAFIKSQSAVFKDLHDNLSMTSEQFSNLNQSLIQDVDIRGVLYKMNERQRQAHFEGLQQEYKTYRIMGLLPGQAENLVKAMEKLSGKSAKERLKEGARLRAIMGGMGMGAQGERAQQLMLKGARATPQEKQELASILKDANEVVSDRMSQGFAHELQTQEMIGKAGLENLLGPNSVMVDAILGKGAIAKSPEQTSAQIFSNSIGETGASIVTAIVNLKDTLVSFLGTNFIAALLVAFGGKSILSKAGDLLGGKGGKGGKLLGGIGSLLASPEGGSLLSKMGKGALKGGILGTVANVGMGAYDMSQNGVTGKNVGGMVGGTAGAVIGGAIGSVIPVFGTAIGATLGGVLGEWGGSKLGALYDYVEHGKTDDEDDRKAKEHQKTLEALEALKEAIASGNEAASKTAYHTLQTQMAIEKQTNQQTEDTQKVIDAQNANVRKIQIRDRNGTSMSPQ